MFSFIRVASAMVSCHSSDTVTKTSSVGESTRRPEDSLSYHPQALSTSSETESLLEFRASLVATNPQCCSYSCTAMPWLLMWDLGFEHRSLCRCSYPAAFLCSPHTLLTLPAPNVHLHCTFLETFYGHKLINTVCLMCCF